MQAKTKLMQVYVPEIYMKHVTGIQWDPSNTDTFEPLKCVLIRRVSSFQGANNTYLYEVGTWSSVLIREVSSFQGCPLRGVPLYYRPCSRLSSRV